jgi:hypothetical protein
MPGDRMRRFIQVPPGTTDPQDFSVQAPLTGLRKEGGIPHPDLKDWAEFDSSRRDAPQEFLHHSDRGSLYFIDDSARQKDD